MIGLPSFTVPPETFTAALLHDVGKLVLGRFLDRDIQEFLERARSDGGRSGPEAETEVLNVNHAELGGLIAAHWKLPRSICVGIQYHHEPEECGDEEGLEHVPWIVHLADLVAARLGRGTHDTVPEDEDFAPALGALGMDERKFGKLIERTERRLEEVGERFN